MVERFSFVPVASLFRSFRARFHAYTLRAHVERKLEATVPDTPSEQEQREIHKRGTLLPVLTVESDGNPTQ